MTHFTLGTNGTRQLQVSTNNGSSYLTSSGDYIQITDTGTDTNASSVDFHTTSSTAARSGGLHIRGWNLTALKHVMTMTRTTVQGLHQFVAARSIQDGNLPSIASDISLQKGEYCHHQTSGSLLEKKIMRTYTIDGEKYKEEALTVSKDGRIYITSKRVLIVGDGTTSIPHSKILDAEIDPDNDVISITKDGRQKPLFLRVPDLIYTGILLEAVSTAPDVDLES
jgi:hypothetical protein